MTPDVGEDHFGVALDGAFGGSGDVGGEYDVGEIEQGAGGGDGVGLVDVEGCAGEFAVGEGVDEGVLLDHFVEGGVDEEGVGLQGGEFVGADHGGGIGGGGGVEGEEVGVLEELFERDQEGTALLLSNFSCVGVVGEDFHVEGGGEFRDYSADGAEADDAEGLTVEFESTVVNVAVDGVFPLTGLEVAVEVGDAAGEGEHEANGVFRDGAGVASGGVDDDDAVLGGGVEVDVVEGGAADAEELEV